MLSLHQRMTGVANAEFKMITIGYQIAPESGRLRPQSCAYEALLNNTHVESLPETAVSPRKLWHHPPHQKLLAAWKNPLTRHTACQMPNQMASTRPRFASSDNAVTPTPDVATSLKPSCNRQRRQGSASGWFVYSRWFPWARLAICAVHVASQVEEEQDLAC